MDSAKTSIVPRCKFNYPQYVSADGQWFPCCFASQRHENWRIDWFQVNRKHFDLNEKSLEEILAGDKLAELETLWSKNQGAGAPYWCKIFCRSPDSGQITSIEEKSASDYS